MTGATAGARPNTIVMLAIRRWASAPAKRSRTTAWPMTRPAPADSPCSTRHSSSQPKLGASAAPTDAAAKTHSDTRITGRRPKASDKVPWNRLMMEKASR